MAGDAELLALLLPSLRVDIAALETHRPVPRAPSSFPMAAFGGTEDPSVPRDHLEAWRGETESSFRVRQFPGGHFYLVSHRSAVLGDLAATLSPAAPAVT